MTTIYGVTEGSYSDYRVNCLFITKELAENYLKKLYENSSKKTWRNQNEVSFEQWFADKNYGIEEFELYDIVPVKEM